MKKYVSIFFFICILVTNSVFAHDNKVIHPFTLTGKAWYLLGMSTGGKMVNGVNVYNDSPYYELSQYFDDQMPSGYWKEGIIWDDFNYDQLVKNGKIGTLGTIAEDRELLHIGFPWTLEVPLYAMKNHFYDVPTGKGMLGFDNPIEAIEIGDVGNQTTNFQS